MRWDPCIRRGETIHAARAHACSSFGMRCSTHACSHAAIRMALPAGLRRACHSPRRGDAAAAATATAAADAHARATVWAAAKAGRAGKHHFKDGSLPVAGTREPQLRARVQLEDVPRDHKAQAGAATALQLARAHLPDAEGGWVGVGGTADGVRRRGSGGRLRLLTGVPQLQRVQPLCSSRGLEKQ